LEREQLGEDASGILMETMLEGMAAYYSKEFAQKIQRGQEINASKFLSLGSNPEFGYIVVNKPLGRFLWLPVKPFPLFLKPYRDFVTYWVQGPKALVALRGASPPRRWTAENAHP